MSVARVDFWRLDGCGDTCFRSAHDPVAHERHGWETGYADAVEERRQKSVTVGCLTVDFLGKIVTVNGERVRLTPSEYAVLAFLVANMGVRYSSNHIETAIWTVGWVRRPGHIVRVNVCRMRKKLGPVAAALIHNEPGLGYMLRANQNDLISSPVRGDQ